LNKNPKQRIGVVDKSEIKKHPFFKGIDWGKLMTKELDPPIILTMDEEGENEEL